MKEEDTFYEKQFFVEACKAHDPDLKGLISVEDLRKVLINDLGEKLTEEEVTEMIKESDLSEEGSIYYEAFVTKMMKT